MYLFDRDEGELELVSTVAGEAPATGTSGTPDVTDDGRHVAFWTSATELGANPATGGQEVVVKDMLTGDIDVVSGSVPDRTPGTEVDGGIADSSAGQGPIVISGDGRHVGYLMTGHFLDGVTPTSTRLETRAYRSTASGSSHTLVLPDPEELGVREVAMSRDEGWMAFSGYEPFVGSDTNGTCDTYLVQVGGGGITLCPPPPTGRRSATAPAARFPACPTSPTTGGSCPASRRPPTCCPSTTTARTPTCGCTTASGRRDVTVPGAGHRCPGPRHRQD